MQFAETDIVGYPPALILETMIERMQDIVPYLENIESIELQDRQDLPDGRLRIVRRWQGSGSRVPSAVLVLERLRDLQRAEELVLQEHKAFRPP